MSLFPQTFIDDLRLQANILQVVLEYVPSLATGTWEALPLAAGNGAMLTLTDATGTNAAQRFYRVRQW